MAAGEAGRPELTTTSGSSLRLDVTEDEAVVRDRNNGNQNYHDNTHRGGLFVGVGPINSHDSPSRSYLKFSLSSLPTGASITQATLYAYLNDEYYPADRAIGAYVAGDGWSETTITWNNAPATTGGPCDTLSPPLSAGHWYSWDVTAPVGAEAAGDGVLTLVLREVVEDTTTYTWNYFAEDEYNSSRAAYIDVEYAAPPVADAGDDQTVEQEIEAGTEVTLDGSGSTGGGGGGELWSEEVPVNLQGCGGAVLYWSHTVDPYPPPIIWAKLTVEAWDVDPVEVDEVYLIAPGGTPQYLGILQQAGSGQTSTTTFDIDPSWLGVNDVQVKVSPDDPWWCVAIDTSLLEVQHGGSGDLTYEWYEGTTLLGTGETLTLTLSLGIHTITLVVTDAAGNSDEDECVVVVQDTTSPELTVPDDITVEQESADGAVVTWECSATDICDTDVGIECDPLSGSTFPLGTTTVTCTATDYSGNETAKTFTVTVEDTTDPSFSLNVLKDKLWPPNHKLHLCATVTGVSDICDADLDVMIVVTSNEPINGKGDGNTDRDWDVVDNGDGTWDVYLRAERDGPSDGREYTIDVTVTDKAGNQSVATATVVVPHDQGKKKGK